MTTIRLSVAGKSMTATLTDSAASRDFVQMLPLTLELSDYASTEKIADLPKKLSTAGAAAGYEPSVGDITYYAPWGNLAIFYRDFGYASGLVSLGRIIQGAEHLKFSGSQKVTIEVIASQR
ncbi:cyclophilin-like fold protein [Rheinheimera marina]|uniref:Cyclophilin-like fold protein n=1 Tax=Rheinheimera marina TaxID=1774958 RepID=A0ABV9JHD9_9GAMM